MASFYKSYGSKFKINVIITVKRNLITNAKERRSKGLEILYKGRINDSLINY